jgi:predicted solute-binding protein
MRIGCVPYDHAKPFWVSWKVEEVVWDHPKELVGRLKRGEVDLALVPVWEVLTGPSYRVVDGLAVGSQGEVRSVAVFHDKPLEECRGISLTPHSMSSVQLWRVVSEGAWGLKLEEREDGEARLRIGDEALREWTERKGRGVTDLGKAWWDWTGKPFVFAVWALRGGFEPKPGEIEKFREGCLAGIAKRAELAEGELEKEYLTKCIRYELGPEEKEGMAEFAKRSGVAMRGIVYL